MGIDDHYWMNIAYEEALLALEKKEVPVGAVLISATGDLISRGHNEVIQKNDPTAHAEIVAIRKASTLLNNYRLVNTILYVTLEPCFMCSAAVVQSRISRVVFACRDWKAGAFGSVTNLAHHPALNHHIQTDEGVLHDACQKLLNDFFLGKRSCTQ